MYLYCNLNDNFMHNIIFGCISINCMLLIYDYKFNEIVNVFLVSIAIFI